MHAFLLKGPKCFVLWTVEGSPRYRGGSCAICTGLASIIYYVYFSTSTSIIIGLSGAMHSNCCPTFQDVCY